MCRRPSPRRSRSPGPARNCARSPDPAVAVHPRSRGEYAQHVLYDGLRPGSSPLARGILRLRDQRPHRRRFIPARAGNTAIRLIPPGPSAVHPRSRGEYRPPRWITDPWFGSSPLARGIPDAGHGGGVVYRFIPARAGNTRKRRACRWCRSVHPRSRGEYTPSLCPIQIHGGSSPLARGIQRRRLRDLLERRFIPARAGNTSSLDDG